MQLARSIMLKKWRPGVLKIALSVFALLFSYILFAQNNSPYSRYGLGNLSANSNVTLRSMGGISAGYADNFSVNFNNPASFSQFYALREQRSKKTFFRTCGF